MIRLATFTLAQPVQSTVGDMKHRKGRRALSSDEDLHAMKTSRFGFTASAFLALIAVSGLALAADDARPAAPDIAELLASSGMTVSGYVAASYSGSSGYPFNIHQFDIRHDSFQLDQAGLIIACQPKDGFGALVDIMAGEDARILHVAEDGHAGSFDLRQAFVQYTTGALTIMAGKMLTLAGAEVINPALNTNFSRSLLFFDSEPLTHTGVRASFALTGTFSLTAGLNNGWNATSTSYGSKTGELSFGWVPNKTFSLQGTAYFGKTDPDFGGNDSMKTLYDFVAIYNATSSLSFILNVDMNKWDDALGAGQNAKWNGIAGYLNCAIADQWRVSVRAEYLDDRDGFLTGSQQKLKEATVTFGYSPVKSFELRLEGRIDKADNDTFFRTRDSRTNRPDANSLTGFAIQGVFRF